MPFVSLAILLWSSLGIVIRLSGMGVAELMFYSALVSSVATGIIIFLKNLRKELSSCRSLFPLVLLAPVSLINTFTFFYAYKHTTIANAVITHYTAPVIVAFLAPLILKERLSLMTFVSALIAMAGLWIMLGFSPQGFFEALLRKDQNSLGIASGVFSGAAYAMVVIIIRALAINYHPVIMTFVQNSIITALLLPFNTSELRLNIWPVLFMGIVHSTIAPVLYFYGMKTVTAQRAALIGYLEPVFSIILGLFFLDEAVGFKTILGGAMVLVSGYLTIAKRQ